jgi:predicted DNA-binding transcriptional regulator YafY
MRVRYAPSVAKWIAERERVKLEADGSAVIEHPLRDEKWAVRHLLQYGPEAEVLGPDRIREALREALIPR